MILARPLHVLYTYPKPARVKRTPQIRSMMASASNGTASRLHDSEPAFIYGTAWKKDQTNRLVKEALAAGFRRVDTAAQPRHYQEAQVGEALRQAYRDGVVKREGVYVRANSTGKRFH